jgi:hypothetical protein
METSFNEARDSLLEVFAEQEGWTLFAAFQEYHSNTEFKRRIDLAALNMSCPTSHSIH